MAKVRLLSDNLINKIAAGEVVERPASVVKELVENSIDAGAKRIDIEVEKGGKRSIRIVDDGLGMSREDALMSLQRHATSKIQSEDDLFQICTKGFRGEAVPSIASVSHFLIQTCEDGADIGTEILVEGGRQSKVSDIGRSRGTTIEVSDLFFNLPARRKFLKTDGTEFAHISEAVIRLAMSHPQVRFRLTHNRVKRLDLHGTTNLKERVTDLLGKDIGKGLYPMELDAGVLSIHGLFSRPDLNIQGSKGIYIFVNGRFIRQKSLTHACREAYRGIMEKGRYPYVVLFLDLPPEEIDVNVHPQKIEVRFRREDEVYGRLMYLLRSAIAASPWATTPQVVATPPTSTEPVNGGSSAGKPVPEQPSLPSQSPLSPGASASLSTSKQREEAPIQHDVSLPVVERRLPSFSPKRKEQEPEKISLVTPAYQPAKAKIEPSPVPAVEESKQEKVAEIMDFAAFQERFRKLLSASNAFQQGVDKDASKMHLPPLPNAQDTFDFSSPQEEEKPTERPVSNFFSSLRYIGQFAQMYLLFEGKEMLFLIDQHAAHERVTYQKLQKEFAKQQIPQQHLLTKQRVELSLSEVELLKEHTAKIESLGISLEHFGGRTFVLSAVPTVLRNAEPALLLRDLLDELSQGLHTGSFDEKRDAVLMRMACHSSVRGPHSLTASEVKALMNQLDKIDFRAHCPHGRPIITEFSRKELEKRFHRT